MDMQAAYESPPAGFRLASPFTTLSVPINVGFVHGIILYKHSTSAGKISFCISAAAGVLLADEFAVSATKIWHAWIVTKSRAEIGPGPGIRAETPPLMSPASGLVTVS